MYLIEKTSVNGGNLAPANAVTFDLPIKGAWVKISYLKIVQRQNDAMNIIFQLWQSTAARTAWADRSNYIQKTLSRQITMPLGGGAEYGEILAGNPIHYYDRDVVTPDNSQHYIHCRLENQPTGKASDFDVQLIVVDPYEASL